MHLLKGIKLLEEAYRGKDWDKVADAYELISGEGLEIAKTEKLSKTIKEYVDTKPKKRGRPKKVLEQSLEPSTVIQKSPQKVLKQQRDDNSQEERRQPRTEPVRFIGNLFVDDGTLAVEDKLIDKKLKKGKGGKGWKRASPRPQHEFVEVDCGTRSCNTIVEVSPELYMADTTYFCPKCLSKKR